MMMDAENGATAKVRNMEQRLVVTMKNVQLAGFTSIVSKFKISLVEIGIVQTVGRMCKYLCCSGDRLGCKYNVSVHCLLNTQIYAHT